jgi:hypothetical protein
MEERQRFNAHDPSAISREEDGYVVPPVERRMCVEETEDRSGWVLRAGRDLYEKFHLISSFC